MVKKLNTNLFMGNEKKWNEVMKIYPQDQKKRLVEDLEAEMIVKFLKDTKVKTVVDIGCGFGEVAIFLAKNTDLQITACDIAEPALKITKEKVLEQGLAKKIKVMKADVFNLPFKDNSFDVAISTGYVSAATHLGATEEVSRVVKNGGYLIFDYIRPYNIYNFLDGSMIPHLKNYCRLKIYHFGSFGLKAYLEKSGLKVITIKRLFTFLPKIQNTFINRLFEKTIGKVLGLFLARILLVKIKNTK